MINWDIFLSGCNIFNTVLCEQQNKQLLIRGYDLQEYRSWYRASLTLLDMTRHLYTLASQYQIRVHTSLVMYTLTQLNTRSTDFRHTWTCLDTSSYPYTRQYQIEFRYLRTCLDTSIYPLHTSIQDRVQISLDMSRHLCIPLHISIPDSIQKHLDMSRQLSIPLHTSIQDRV